MTEIHDRSAVTLRRQLGAGEVLAVDVTRHYLERIDALDDELGAFITVTRDEALERAERLDTERAAFGTDLSDLRRKPLWGLPFADKDLEPRAGVRTTFGSRAFHDFVPVESGALAQTLDLAGGVSLGKTNTPEFGMPAYTENAIGPAAVTPWDTTRGAGGSSGGAAVAVAAGLLPVAPGSDGGGSVRIPASATGLVGLKTTRGRVPDGSGIGSLGGLGVAGPLGRRTEDVALLLDAMIARRPDGSPADRSVLVAPPGERSYLEALELAGGPLRIGVNTWSPWTDRYEVTLDDGVAAVFESAQETLGRLGHELVPLTPAAAPGYSDAFRTVWQAGAATLPLDEDALARVEPLTRWLVGVGRTKTAGELAAALSYLAGFERSIIAQYSEVDVVLTPTLAMPPVPVGWFDHGDGERNFEQQCQFTPYTSYVNVVGLPALSMPFGEHEGLPVGIQAIGRPGAEATLLALSAQLERETRWDLRYPPAWRRRVT